MLALTSAPGGRLGGSASLALLLAAILGVAFIFHGWPGVLGHLLCGASFTLESKHSDSVPDTLGVKRDSVVRVFMAIISLGVIVGIVVHACDAHRDLDSTPGPNPDPSPNPNPGLHNCCDVRLKH